MCSRCGKANTKKASSSTRSTRMGSPSATKSKDSVACSDGAPCAETKLPNNRRPRTPHEAEGGSPPPTPVIPSLREKGSMSWLRKEIESSEPEGPQESMRDTNQPRRRDAPFV